MPAGRRALVVATGRYDDPDLRKLRSPAQDAPALARVLADPDIALASPEGVALAGDGSVYVADTGNHRIRLIGVDGVIVTVAGNGAPGSGGDGDLAIEAGLDTPRGIALDQDGSLYIADTGNDRVRVIDTDGIITTLKARYDS